MHPHGQTKEYHHGRKAMNCSGKAQNYLSLVKEITWDTGVHALVISSLSLSDLVDLKG